MKHPGKILLGALLATAIQFTWTGCAGPGGGGGGVYYGGDPWIQDDVVVTGGGRGWFGGGHDDKGYVHPDAGHAAPAPRAEAPRAEAPRASGGGRDDDHHK
jgi:hypothetical protein